MLLRQVDDYGKSREFVNMWQGYNHNIIQSIGEFWNTENLSFRRYPILSPRNPYSKLQLMENPAQNVVSLTSVGLVKNKIAFVSMVESGKVRKTLYHNDAFNIQLLSNGYMSDCSILSGCGDKVILFPHKAEVFEYEGKKTNKAYQVESVDTAKEIGIDTTNAFIYESGATLALNSDINGNVLFPVVSNTEPRGQAINRFVWYTATNPTTQNRRQMVAKMNEQGALENYAKWNGSSETWVGVNNKIYRTENSEVITNPKGIIPAILDGDIVVMSPSTNWNDVSKSDVYIYHDLQEEMEALNDIVFSIDGAYAFWIDISDAENPLFKEYSGTTESWITYTNNYTRIGGIKPGLFKAGDSIRIDAKLNSKNEENQYYYIEKIINSKDSDVIIIRNLCSVGNGAGTTIPATTRFLKEIPALDFVTVAQNRLWGCRYAQVDGKTVNQLYASKLGDPSNWNVFQGISTDSYQITLDDDEEFTGIISLNNQPYFFKENAIYTIYGGYPESYQLIKIDCEGCERGSSKSIVKIDNMIFLNSPNGICIFDGTGVTNISDAFGGVHYHNAVAGATRGKYYVSMFDENNNPSTFVFDIKYQMWHKLDNKRYSKFVYNNAGLLIGFYGGQGFSFEREYNITSTEEDIVMADGKENKVKWLAETGPIDFAYPDNKRISRFKIRAIVPTGSTLRAYIEYDSNNDWQQIGTIYGDGKALTTLFNTIPQSCDHYALRFEGEGDTCVISLANDFEDGDTY